MKLIRPNAAEAAVGIRAIHQVATAAGPLAPAARRMMEAAQSLLLPIRVDLDTLDPITPDALAAGLPDPELRQQIVDAMVVVSLVDGVPEPATTEMIRAYADALGISESVLDAVDKLARHHVTLFRLDYYRRSHLRAILEDQVRHHGGLIGLAKGVLRLRGMSEDPELAAPYQALGELPPETFGYQAFRHHRDHGFSLPGERYGFPEAGFYHDLTHVLSGYGPSPEGEVQVAAFTAGYRPQNSLHMLLFGVITFSTGFNLTPAEQPDTTGLIGRGDLAERLIIAVDRGSKVNTDLSDNWDFWPYMPLSLEEARARLGVPPMP